MLPAEWQRTTQCLERLLPYVDASSVALTGGVALATISDETRDQIKDIDFVVRHMEAIDAMATRDFLVSHYHVVQPGVPTAIIQLVDPRARLHIDFFPDAAGVVERAHSVKAVPYRVLEAADLLAHKLQLLRKPADEKHWRDAVFLAGRCGVAAPARPASSRPDDYCQAIERGCERCKLSHDSSFPLAPKRAIFEILGYV